ncbi:hypothetical protein [Halalkalicoccus subterraneus]|uniref:hypothetical protein n=1 Tax=Halalkalicoccus subterraneus TaxID=2675002 RepID=UPI000EFACE9D|nr:hypothetical protein [Halalkalicoccus subterraneus]
MIRIDTSAVGSGLILAGLLHLLAPQPLLNTAGDLYRRVLAVDFRRTDRTERRVRAVGLAMLAAGTVVSATDGAIEVSTDG